MKETVFVKAFGKELEKLLTNSKVILYTLLY